MPTPLLSEDDRKEVIRLYSEMKDKYGALDSALAAGKPTGEVKAQIEKVTADIVTVTEKYEKLAERADAIEEKQRQKPNLIEEAKSIGQQVIEDPRMVAFLKSAGQGSCTVSVKGPIFGKDITNVSRGLPDMLSVVAQGPRLSIGVRSLVPGGRTTAGAVSYVEETSFTNNAAPVAEGAAKPKSDKVFTPKTLPVETIAHYFKVSKQTADDLPFLVALIEQNGIYGVKKVEDNQILNGTGTTPQLKGIVPLATAATAAAAGSSLVDAIGIAVFQLAAAGFMPDGAVVNPVDWGAVSLLKNSQGNYLFANPLEYSSGGRIWGTRLVQSANMAAGTFLVGAFQGNSLLLDREEVNVQVANMNEDDFIKNMLSILVEERLVLIVLNAAAFLKGVKPAPVI